MLASSICAENNGNSTAALIFIAEARKDERLLARLVVTGYTLYHAGNHHKSIVMFVLALRLEPSNMDSLELLGVSLQHAGSTNCAQAFHHKVLELDGTRPVPMLNLGLLGLFSGDQGRVSEAITRLEAAAAASARDPSTLHLAAAAVQALGSAHAMLGDARAALRHFSACVRLAPHATACRLSAAAVHSEEERPELAIRMFAGVLATLRPLDLTRSTDRLVVLELCLLYGTVAAWSPQRRLLPFLDAALALALRRGEELPPKAASAALFLPIDDGLLLPIVRALSRAAAASAPPPPAPWPTAAGRYDERTVHVAYVSGDFGDCTPRRLPPPDPVPRPSLPRPPCPCLPVGPGRPTVYRPRSHGANARLICPPRSRTRRPAHGARANTPCSLPRKHATSFTAFTRPPSLPPPSASPPPTSNPRPRREDAGRPAGALLAPLCGCARACVRLRACVSFAPAPGPVLFAGPDRRPCRPATAA